MLYAMLRPLWLRATSVFMLYAKLRPLWPWATLWLWATSVFMLYAMLRPPAGRGRDGVA